jgi:hypothetical protein
MYVNYAGIYVLIVRIIDFGSTTPKNLHLFQYYSVFQHATHKIYSVSTDMTVHVFGLLALYTQHEI